MKSIVIVNAYTFPIKKMISSWPHDSAFTRRFFEKFGAGLEIMFELKYNLLSMLGGDLY